MDDYIRSDPIKRFTQATIDVDRMALRPVSSRQRSGKRRGLLRRPSADQQVNAVIVSKAVRDIAAEIAITADDENARYHAGLVTISQKMRIRPPNAGQPSKNHRWKRRS